jgi:glucose dehydrogenase
VIIVRVLLGVVLTALVAVALRGSSSAENDYLGWPTYGFNYENTRHAAIDDINGSNVARLVPVWRFVLGPHERVETTPIVVGRTLYATTGLGNNVVALDATTGKQEWRYRRCAAGHSTAA